MHSLKYILSLILIAAGLSCCTEKIDLELDSTYTRLVVDGAITNQPGPHQIKLSYTADYFDNKPPLSVSGAEISLSDGLNSWMITESSPGIYETPEGFQGAAGSYYSLLINKVELDGKQQSFEAKSGMPPVSPIDSIQVEFEPNWKIWAIKLYTLDPPSKDFYMFKVYVNNILVTDTIDRWVVVSDDFFNGNYTFGVLVQFIRETEAQVGDTVRLEMASITEEYAKFIAEIQQASGYNNPLFSGPPANVRSNITNGAIGFFSAYSTSLSEAVIRKK